MSPAHAVQATTPPCPGSLRPRRDAPQSQCWIAATPRGSADDPLKAPTGAAARGLPPGADPRSAAPARAELGSCAPRFSQTAACNYRSAPTHQRSRPPASTHAPSAARPPAAPTTYTAPPICGTPAELFWPVCPFRRSITAWSLLIVIGGSAHPVAAL